MMFFSGIPLLLLFVMPATQLVLSILRISGRIRLSIMTITMLSMFLSCLILIAAYYIALINLPPGPKCGIEGVAFFLFGVLITIALIPIIGLVAYFIYLIFCKRNIKTAYKQL
jgi:hypothetical protein